MRLIDADRLKWKAETCIETTDAFIELIDKQPTELLIHCKDCKFAHMTYGGECKYCDLEQDEYGNLFEAYRPGDWFCAGAEPKDKTEEQP